MDETPTDSPIPAALPSSPTSAIDDPPITSSEDQHRVFALIIGINKYKSDEIPDLAGCENDANSFKDFLLNTLHVHPSRIAVLLSEEATRDRIISTFQKHFIENSEIQEGNAIVFFYAGHGSRVPAPEGWVSDDSMIETICPHDQSTRRDNDELIHGIPDRTVNGLLRKLSSVKGNNITVIFDSCHSGGITRDLYTNVRSIQTRIPLPVGLDRAIWSMESTRHGTAVLPAGFLHKSIASHVLLAACRQEETAKEGRQDGRMHGAFTQRLINELKNGISTTYAALHDRLLQQLGTDQHPVCEGTNKNQVLFSGTAVDVQQPAFKVTTVNPGQYRADAGAIHGVIKGMEFLIYSGDIILPGDSELGILVVTAVQDRSCDLRHRPEDEPFTVPESSRALASRGTDRALLKVFLDSDERIDGISQVSDRSKLEQQIEQLFPMVSSRDEAHVVVLPSSSGTLQLEGVDSRIPSYANPVLKDVSPDSLLRVLDGIAHFNFHLHRDSKSHPFHKHVTVKMVQLKEEGFADTGQPLYETTDTEQALVTDQENTIRNLETPYCFMIENHSQRNLFAYLFYFDPSDYSVQAWYVPPSSTMSAPLARRQGTAPSVISVGYGSTGGDPIQFSLLDGETSDTGFLKLFVSTTYVNMDIIEQETPLKAHSRHGGRGAPMSLDLWDTWKYEITCRQPDSS